MPYTKEHKAATRRRILESAFRLFTIKGFDGVTVNGIMEDSGLTRGAFYSHFSSKAELYRESLTFAASSTKLAGLKPAEIDEQAWLGILLDGYLSLEHVRGEYPCPLAFLVTDIITQDEEAKETYANVFLGMNKAILNYAKSYTECDEKDILSLTAMLIGSVAIARTMSDEISATKLLQACRQEAMLKLGIE